MLGSTEENQTSNNDDSGAITVTNTATSITTYGRDSNAFVVQSIAGGGGYVARSEEKLTLGSTNETNVNSGDLDVYNASTINTFGNASAGLIAQTVSGGGGFVGSTEATEITLGGESVKNGAGGSIKLQNIGDITTIGESAPLIVVQSIGGGGGFTTSKAIPTTSSTTRLGDQNSQNTSGGDINFKNTGNLTSFGSASSGILIQSIGGGGGMCEELKTHKQRIISGWVAAT